MTTRMMTACVAVVLGVALLAGCARQSQPQVAPVPDELTPRPTLSSVPAESTRVAAMSGGRGFQYDLVRGQRYFVVDEDSDRLLTSDVANRDGILEVTEDGATFRRRSLDWPGEWPRGSTVGLYVNRKLEEVR